jgi:hypothetical protein
MTVITGNSGSARPDMDRRNPACQIMDSDISKTGLFHHTLEGFAIRKFKH